MKKLYQLSLSFFILGALVSCTGESVSTSNQDHEEGPFYVEFVSCSKGSEYSNSNLSDMIQSWRMLPISN